ncbi:uncharacterized protein LOC126979488 [Leptidea sinapis]|uniref:uncharacterized protein LOC126979488 n=1 Tax=Leptidea sinapis TaxID=189913 RepID=UPI0021C2BA70|nr:uncharacterized protein LOC126979488 [Leptidea sinapis]
MAAIGTRRTLSQLIKQGYQEIPEIFASTALGLVGIGLGAYSCYRYVKNDGDNRRYKQVFIVMRPDDPRVQKLRKD